MVLSAAGAQLTQVVPTGQSRRCRALAHFLRLPPVSLFILFENPSLFIHYSDSGWFNVFCVSPVEFPRQPVSASFLFFFSFLSFFSLKRRKDLAEEFQWGSENKHGRFNNSQTDEKREKWAAISSVSLFVFKKTTTHNFFCVRSRLPFKMSLSKSIELRGQMMCSH
jgi:hypothetical protein